MARMVGASDAQSGAEAAPFRKEEVLWGRVWERERQRERELADEKNDDRELPPDVDVVVGSAAPTPTEEYPVELRTSPPTPTALFPPSLQTAPPTKEGATTHPTTEPTTGPTTASPLPRWKQVVVGPISTVRTEWDADDTIVTTILLLFFVIVTCVYCVCCRRNKESLHTSGRSASKGDYSAIDQHDRLRPTSPVLSGGVGGYNRGSDYGIGGRVVVHNPMAETSPLLSPPRNKEKLAARRDAREQRDTQQVPVRAPRQIPPARFAPPEEELGSDIDGDLNI